MSEPRARQVGQPKVNAVDIVAKAICCGKGGCAWPAHCQAQESCGTDAVKAVSALRKAGVLKDY